MNEKFMLEAINQATKAVTKDEVPVGCVIVRNNKIIAKAHNTKEKHKSSIYHAEINALIKAAKKTKDWRLDDCEMYVTLEPCLMCVGAIINYRIKNVYFGAYDKSGGALVSNLDIKSVKNLGFYPNFIGGIKEKECSEILTNYFKGKRNK